MSRRRSIVLLVCGFTACGAPQASPPSVVSVRADPPASSASSPAAAPGAPAAGPPLLSARFVFSPGRYTAIADVVGATVLYDGETYHDRDDPAFHIGLATGEQAREEPALARGITPPAQQQMEQVVLRAVAGTWPADVYLVAQRHLQTNVSVDDYELYRRAGSGWARVGGTLLSAISTSGPNFALAARAGRGGVVVLAGGQGNGASFTAFSAPKPPPPPAGSGSECATRVLATRLVGAENGDVWSLGVTCDEAAAIDFYPAGAAAALPQTIPQPAGRLTLTDVLSRGSGETFVVGGIDDQQPYAARFDGVHWTALTDLPMRRPLTSISGGGDGSLWITDAAPGGLWRRAPDGVWARVSFQSLPPGARFTPRQVRALPSGDAWLVGCFADGRCGAMYVAPNR